MSKELCLYFWDFYTIFLSDPTDALKKVPDKLEVLRLLHDIRARWNMIGTALNVDSGTLEIIDCSGKSNDKLADMIKAWIDTEPSPVTWETLIKAIEEPPINHKRIAKEIRDHLGIRH